MGSRFSVRIPLPILKVYYSSYLQVPFLVPGHISYNFSFFLTGLVHFNFFVFGLQSFEISFQFVVARAGGPFWEVRHLLGLGAAAHLGGARGVAKVLFNDLGNLHLSAFKLIRIN